MSFFRQLGVFFLLLLCHGCGSCPEKVPPYTVQQFDGRDEIIAYGQTVRRPVYQAKVPLTWTRIDPKETESLQDTTRPILSFRLDDQLFLTIHNFPTQSIEERIHPEMQVERWKQQSQPETSLVQRFTQGGFYGLYFEGTCQETTVCAWAFQLDFDHYQTLHFLATTVEEEEHYRQMAADITLKISGPTHLIQKHKRELTLFSESFELIQEIPSRM